MASPYLRFDARRVAVSLAAALVLVPLVSLATKAIVEGATSLTYEIHWFETVPLIVLGVAFVLNGWLNERAESE